MLTTHISMVSTQSTPMRCIAKLSSVAQLLAVLHASWHLPEVVASENGIEPRTRESTQVASRREPDVDHTRL